MTAPDSPVRWALLKCTHVAQSRLDPHCLTSVRQIVSQGSVKAGAESLVQGCFNEWGRALLGVLGCWIRFKLDVCFRCGLIHRCRICCAGDAMRRLTQDLGLGLGFMV